MRAWVLKHRLHLAVAVVTLAVGYVILAITSPDRADAIALGVIACSAALFVAIEVAVHPRPRHRSRT